MTIEGLREFYRRAGFRIARTATADFLVPARRLYHAFPIGPVPPPTPAEIEALCRHPGILGLQLPNDRGVGVPGGLWTQRGAPYGVGSLQRQFRQHVERSRETQNSREIGFDELEQRGLACNRETLARQRRDDPLFSRQDAWHRLCEAGRDTPGAVAFATFDATELTAYLVGFVAGETCYGLFSKSRTRARQTGANHLLYFSYTDAMRKRPGLTAVTAGLKSHPPNASLDRFKRHAGYELVPHHTAVFLRPWFHALLMSGPATAALRLAARLPATAGTARRVEAVREAVRAEPAQLG